MLIEVNGTRLHYEKRGEGRPLILLHGNGEDHTIFQQALLLLEKRFCCYAVDSRCHGQSLGGALHYSEMAEDMLCFMEQLDLRDVIFSDGPDLDAHCQRGQPHPDGDQDVGEAEDEGRIPVPEGSEAGADAE